MMICRTLLLLGLVLRLGNRGGVVSSRSSISRLAFSSFSPGWGFNPRFAAPLPTLLEAIAASFHVEHT